MNDLNRIFSFTEKSFYFHKFFSMIIECVEIHFTTASVLPAIQSRWMQNSHPLHNRLSPYIDGQYSKFTKPSKIMSNVSFHEEAFHHLCEQFLQTIYQNALQKRNRFLLKFIQWSLLELPRKKEREQEREAMRHSIMKEKQLHFQKYEKLKELDNDSLMYRLNQLAAKSRDDVEQEIKESTEEIDEAFTERKTSEGCFGVLTPPNEEEIRKEARVEEIDASKGRVHIKRVEAVATIQSRKVGGSGNPKRVWRPSSTSGSFGKPFNRALHVPPMTHDAMVRRPGAVPSPLSAKPQTGRRSPISKEVKEVKDIRLISIDENEKSVSRPESGRPTFAAENLKDCEERTVSNDFTEISKSYSRSKGDEHNFITPLSIFRDEITSILSLFKEEIVSLKKELEEQKTQAAVLHLPVNQNMQEFPSSLPNENSNKSVTLNPVTEPVIVEDLAMSAEAKDNITADVEFPEMKLGSETAVDNIYEEKIIKLSSGSLPASTRTSMLRGSDNNVSTRASASALLLEHENHQLKSELENMQKKLESFEASLQQTQQMTQQMEEQKLQQLQEQWQQNTHQLLQSTTETARQQLLQEFQELFQAKEEEMRSLRSALSETQVKMTKLESEKRKAVDTGFNYASSSNLLLKFNVVEERLEKKFLSMTEAKAEEVNKDDEVEESPLTGVARYFLPCSDKFSEKRYMNLPKKLPGTVEVKDVVKKGSEETSMGNPNAMKKIADHKEAESTRVRKQPEVTVKLASSKMAVVFDAPRIVSTNLPSDSPLSGVAQYSLPQKLSEELSPLTSVSKYFPGAERPNSSEKRESPVSEQKKSEEITKNVIVPSKPPVSKKQSQTKEQPQEEHKPSNKPSSPAVPEVHGYYYDEDSPLGGVATYFLDQRSEDEESPLCGVARYFLNHIEVSRSSPASPKLPHVPKSPQAVKPTDKARLNYPGRGNSGKLTI